MFFDFLFCSIQSIEELWFLECFVFGTIEIFWFIVGIDYPCTESDDVVHSIVDGEGDPMMKERIDIASCLRFFCQWRFDEILIAESFAFQFLDECIMRVWRVSDSEFFYRLFVQFPLLYEIFFGWWMLFQLFQKKFLH